MFYDGFVYIIYIKAIDLKREFAIQGSEGIVVRLD